MDSPEGGIPLTPRIVSCPRQGTFGRNEVVWDMDNVLLYHIYVLGGPAVGKTQLLKNFADSPSSEHNPNPHCYQKQVRLLDKFINPEELSTILLQIVESSTFPDFSDFDRDRVDGIGFICIYSVNSPSSVEDARKFLDWIMHLKKRGEPPATLILGNKKDTPRKVTTQEGRDMASAHSFPFLEISALSCCDEVFNEIIREISFKREQENMPLEKKGWLEKRSGEIVKMWKKRWVVLEDGSLCLYRRETTSGKKKDITDHFELNDCIIEEVPKIQNGFSVRTCDKTFYFKAPSVEQKIQWTRLLTRASEAYLHATDSSEQPIGFSGNHSNIGTRKKNFRSSVARYNSIDELFSNVRPRSKSTSEMMMEDEKNIIGEQTNGPPKTQSGPLQGGPIITGTSNAALPNNTSSPRLSMLMPRSQGNRTSTHLSNPNSANGPSPRQKQTLLPYDFDEPQTPSTTTTTTTSSSSKSDRKKHWKLFGRSSFFQSSSSSQ